MDKETWKREFLALWQRGPHENEWEITKSSARPPKETNSVVTAEPLRESVRLEQTQEHTFGNRK